ncbi:hypothetical protein CASFOL_032505 [Castilleja foliolosa]|uniref:MATH domain-containing protein n=1 Tax=Castilleja foliolosa TaxID=1961234 RepID=A0ABD3C2J2_9LAMI
METRVVSPANFLLKIDSFSLLHKHGIYELKTKEFKSGDYKWRLVIYPNGKDEEGYISIYLAIADKSALPSTWEVNATFSICLFNHISDNYRYSIGSAVRFHALKPEWGFKKFISKKNLTDLSKGYLVDDKCVFGAEIFVNEHKTVTQSLSLNSVYTDPYKREFKISNFSILKEKWVSKVFEVGGHKWKIEAHPNGCEEETGRSLSIFLSHIVSNNRPSSERVCPCFTMRVKDQSSDHKHHQMTLSDRWFSASEAYDWGWYSFIELSSLKDPNKGFIVNDCCLLEIEITVVFAVSTTRST